MGHNGAIIVGGWLQLFIVTVAMMEGALGGARLTTGQDNTGSNAFTDKEAGIKNLLDQHSADWKTRPMT